MRKGEIIGLLGVNGAGKSTLMKILSGIIPPDSGQVTFFGKELSADALDIKKQTGYLSEDNPLYEDMYVKEYLEYVAGIYKADKHFVLRIIEQTGLQTEYKKKIKALSKGNRQRVGIAQALIGDPVFLILDEATSGLDPNQRESLNKLFVELSANKIILFSTHILQEVRDICTRLILLNKGELVVDKQITEIESVEQTFHTLTNEYNS
jgi:ABC-2 type transport system ATP-binding protein